MSWRESPDGNKKAQNKISFFSLPPAHSRISFISPPYLPVNVEKGYSVPPPFLLHTLESKISWAAPRCD